MTDFIGHQFDKYEIIDEIARGGMATIYRARQTSALSREVAIKVLPPQFTHDKTFLERFYREVEVIASLQHPHILPVYDFGEYDNCPYIVMAYINGGTLADLMAQGRLELGQISTLIQQIAGALEYAHSKGIIHRDFKPSNVLLDEQGNAYLADFGLAKVLETNSQITGTSILGTPTYMAPQQAKRASEITPSVDVYALGVTIYQMLSGKPPYEAPSAFGILMAHARQPVPDIRGIRPELSTTTQRVIDRSMAKQVADRYPTPIALANGVAEAVRAELKSGTSEMPSLEVRDALIMTNTLGRIIFVDNACLKMLKYHHSEARSIIGKPMSDIVGLDADFTMQLLETIGEAGSVRGLELVIKDSHDNTLPIRLKAVATRDSNGEYIGADLAFSAATVAQNETPDFQSEEDVLSSSESTLLQNYFTAHMQNLYEIAIQLGGKRFGSNLEQIVNDTAEQNVWPVTMAKGKVSVGDKNADADIYQALLAKAVTYCVKLVGRNMVIKGMQRVNKKMDSSVRRLADEMMLDDFINDII